jgi:hypothetical protein
MTDPKPAIGAPRVRMARRLTLKTGGWYLSLRERVELGPFPTANAAMTASRDLDARLQDVDCEAADQIIEAFLEEQRRRFAF